MEQQVDNGPNLLLDWRALTYAPRWKLAGVGSVLVHVFVLGFLTFMIELPPPARPPEKEIERVIHRVTPLYAPRFLLTQKDPNKGKPTQELSIQNLVSQQAAQQTVRTPPAPPVRKFEAKTRRPDVPAIKVSEPPAVQAKAKAPAIALQAGAINVPPPKPAEEPKLVFQAPGQEGDAPILGGSKIAPPKTGVDDAIKNVARGLGRANIPLNETEPSPNLPDSMRAPPVNGATKIMPELLSDPQGVDFKPYIIRVLSLVRRNWMAIMPEGVRIGRRGVVTLQFIVDRSGQVPKLVIASTSGVDALDRAAVAGVSASVPLPPLPPEFQGKEVRLQFSFKYNMQ